MLEFLWPGTNKSGPQVPEPVEQASVEARAQAECGGVQSVDEDEGVGASGSEVANPLSPPGGPGEFTVHAGNVQDEVNATQGGSGLDAEPPPTGPDEEPVGLPRVPAGRRRGKRL